MEATFQKYPAYKISGVEWLRGFAEHWEVKKLKYCLKSSPPSIEELACLIHEISS